MNIQIQITGQANVEQKLVRLGSSLYRLDKSMRQIGEYMARYFGSQGFASQGQVFNNTWPRLNSQYSVWKAKHFPGRPPEVRTGEMQNSFNFQSGSQTVRVGNDKDYFYFQNEGTSRGLPARQMMGINTTNKRMIADILSAEIREKLASV